MLKSKIRNIISVAFLLMLAGAHSLAQEYTSLKLLPGLSQQSYLNPAIRNTNDKLVIGVPFLSGMHIGWNAGFPLDALFSNGLWNYSFFDFYENLQPEGDGQASGTISMFYASLNTGDYTFQVSLSERFFGTTHFDRDIIKLIRDGVEPYLYRDEDFGKGSFHYRHYRELALGISYQYWKELDIGIRPKVLFGKMYFDAQDINFSVETDYEEDAVLVKPEGEFTLAAPVSFMYDSVYDFTVFSANVFPADYSFNFRNIGVAIDAGIVWRPDKYLRFSVSVLDFGYTGFRHNTANVKFTEPVVYNEKGMYQSVNPAGEGYLESREALRNFTDSVSYVVDAKWATERALDLLPFKINSSVEYNFSNMISGGFSNEYSYYGRNSVDMFSAFITKKQGKFQAGASISMYNFKELMAGLGFTFTGDKTQFFMSMNNISGIIDPAGTKRLNLSLGMNFLFHTERK